MTDSSTIQRTFQYRLKPTKAQRALELCRSVYNSTLAVRKNAYEREGQSLSLHSTQKRLPIWKRDAKDIARLQRKKEQFPKGSPEWRKVVTALNHAYQRQANRRNNFAHQESRKLVDRFGLIVFEKLDIADMQSNGRKVINRNIADVAWGRFVQYSRYKAESAGRAVVLVNPRGTTQECCGCGEVVPKDLSVRVHECPHCGLKIDRDLNAALNILGRGLASIGADSSVTRRSPRL